MRAVIQRVIRGQVTVDGEVTGRIGTGLLVLIGSMEGDGDKDVSFVANRICTLRVFPDASGKMNLNIQEVDGSVLLVSQFTLAADTTSGTRPSFSRAMAPEPAEQAILDLANQITASGVPVEQGIFGAKMDVELVNDGPVTIIIDSQAKVRK